jgi:carotenoid cleavage dioxygenase
MSTYGGSHSTTHLLGSGYQPVGEETTVLRPEVTGTLPAGLAGRFLHLGPGRLGSYDPARDHQFGGEAMVHGIELRDGRASWYRNRWLRGDRVAAALGELPVPGPRRGLAGNAGAGLVRHAGRLLALGGAGVLPHRLGPLLQTLDRVDFDGALPGGLCPRPVVDPLTDELHAVSCGPEPDRLYYLTLDDSGRVTRREALAAKGAPLMTALSLTDRHVVFYDLPVTYDQEEAAAGSPVPYSWDEAHGARLGIMPRGGDAGVLWVTVDPCFVFHPVNAYERGRQIVVDVVRHERVFDRDRLHPSESTPRLWRWTVDPAAGTVEERMLFDDAEEFPCIDERYAAGPHRWVWSVGLDPDRGAALAGPRLLRHDLHGMRTDAHELGPGREAGAPVFVPRGAGAPEGDGWLLSPVHDLRTGLGELVVIDTDDFTGPPVATVHLPVRMPHGLSSVWDA